MEDTILRGLTGVCPREPGGQGPGGAAGSLLHGPISHRGPHHPGGHGPEEEGREGSKTEPMPSRAPAAKASRTSPPGLRREVCWEPRAASLASPCLLSFPTWSPSVPEPSAPGRPPKGKETSAGGRGRRHAAGGRPPRRGTVCSAAQRGLVGWRSRGSRVLRVLAGRVCAGRGPWTGEVGREQGPSEPKAKPGF